MLQDTLHIFEKYERKPEKLIKFFSTMNLYERLRPAAFDRFSSSSDTIEALRDAWIEALTRHPLYKGFYLDKLEQDWEELYLVIVQRLYPDDTQTDNLSAQHRSIVIEEDITEPCPAKDIDPDDLTCSRKETLKIHPDKNSGCPLTSADKFSKWQKRCSSGGSRKQSRRRKRQSRSRSRRRKRRSRSRSRQRKRSRSSRSRQRKRSRSSRSRQRKRSRSSRSRRSHSQRRSSRRSRQRTHRTHRTKHSSRSKRR